MFHLVLAFILVASEAAFAQQQPIGTTTLKTDTTLFMSPGFDHYEQPNAQESKIAWPRAGTTLTIWEYRPMLNKGYFRVTFTGDKSPTIHKWVSSSSSALSPITFSSPAMENAFKTVISKEGFQRPQAPTIVAPARPEPPRVSAPNTSIPQGASIGGARNVILPNDITPGSLREGVRDLAAGSMSGIRTVDQITAEYGNPFRSEIHRTSLHFGISENFLTCLLYHESDSRRTDRRTGRTSGRVWDNHAVSPAGARGLGQFMPVTERLINRVLGERFRLPTAPSSWRPPADDNAPMPYCKRRGDSPEKCTERAIRWWQHILDNPTEFNIRDKEYARTKLEMYESQRQWKSYFPPGRAPTKIDVNKPEHAIPAAGFYLRSIINKTLRYIPERPWDEADSLTAQDVYDFNLALGAGYNAGEGVLIRKISNVRPPSPAGWRRAMANHDGETANHMRKVGECMGTPSTADGQQSINRNQNESRGSP